MQARLRDFLLLTVALLLFAIVVAAAVLLSGTGPQPTPPATQAARETTPPSLTPKLFTTLPSSWLTNCSPVSPLFTTP